MKKIILLFIMVLVLSSFAFALSRNVMYSYDYNRHFSGKKDFLIGFALSSHTRDFEFKNKSTKKQLTDEKNGIAFSLELLERNPKLTWYQNIDFSKAEGIHLDNASLDVKTVNFRVGATKDFFVATSIPFTTFFGMGLVGRMDWFVKSQERFKETAYIGVTLRTGINVHFFENGLFDVFFHYQPDIFVLTNATASKSAFSFTKKWRMDNTFTLGVLVNFNQTVSMLQNRSAEKLAKKIAY